MASFRHVKPLETGYYVAIIGDEDTVTGFLLTGVGHQDVDRSTNFFVVKSKTTVDDIEKAFDQFAKRDDIAILVINQFIADMIRDKIRKFDRPLPTILEIPSKDNKYKPESDDLFKRVSTLLGLAV